MLLGAVVEVAADALAFGVLHLDQAATGVAQIDRLRGQSVGVAGQLGGQAERLEAQRRLGGGLAYDPSFGEQQIVRPGGISTATAPNSSTAALHPLHDRETIESPGQLGDRDDATSVVFVDSRATGISSSPPGRTHRRLGAGGIGEQGGQAAGRCRASCPRRRCARRTSPPHECSGADGRTPPGRPGVAPTPRRGQAETDHHQGHRGRHRRRLTAHEHGTEPERHRAYTAVIPAINTT